MSTKIIRISCSDYKFDNLNLEKVSKFIDDVLVDNFSGKDVVLRAIQSEKHDLPKDKIIELIINTGSDRYESKSTNEVKVNNIHIDLFGMACKIKDSISIKILEGFHKWKPKCLERPQLKLDIWMIYDANSLNNIEYLHSYYHVKARDGYTFKDPKHKVDALIGVLIID
ncbi:MAG: hypothetical protein WCK26_01855 [Candidatus Saccharibacteria bacterium]